jgi:hypothetical protein
LKKSLIVIAVLISSNLYSQGNSDLSYLKTDSSLNQILAIRLKAIVNWEQYSNENTIGASFMKFKVNNGSIDSVTFTGRPPAVITSSFNNAVRQSASLFNESQYFYLLPIIYVFEMPGKKPKETTASNLVHLLKDIYEDKKPIAFPGQGNFEPFQCIILNPYLIKSSW